jgi:Ca-activated chloride channel homolog
MLFGIYGALGCLLTAILFGEIFLYLTQLPPSIKTAGQSIVLLMDTSSSMQNDNRIAESKTAALDFVKRRDLLTSCITFS